MPIESKYNYIQSKTVKNMLGSSCTNDSLHNFVAPN